MRRFSLLLCLATACSGGSDDSAPAGPACTPDEDWVQAEPLAMARESFGMAAAGDRLLAVGGWTGAGASASVEVLQDAGWTAGTPLPGAREHGALVADGARAFFVGGDDGALGRSDVWIREGGSWSATTSLPEGRSVVRAAIAGGRLVLTGGTDAGFGISDSTLSAPLNASGLGPWTAGPPLPEPIMGHSLIGLGTALFLLGGDSGMQGLDGILRSEVGESPGPWQEAGSLPASGLRNAVAVGDSAVAVVGGTASFGDQEGSRRAWIGSLDAGQLGDWVQLPSLPSKRFAHGLAWDGTRLWVSGGYDSGGSVVDDSWSLTVCP